MLQRRLMLTGGIAPAIVRLSSVMPISILASRIVMPRIAPAIVSPGALMPISPVPQPVRFVARIRHTSGSHSGSTTLVGEAPFDDLSDLTSVINKMIGQMVPWGATIRAGGAVEIHILRQGESALPLLT